MKYLGFTFIFFLFIFSVNTQKAEASHARQNLHWPEKGSWPIRIIVRDYTGPELICGSTCPYTNWVEETLSDWEEASHNRLKLVYERRDNKDCDKIDHPDGVITICDSETMIDSGSAGIHTDGNHITRANIKIHTQDGGFGWFSESTLCEEFGHVLGLWNHADDPLTSCVNPGTYLIDPGPHDIEAIRNLYDHRH